MEPDFNTDVGKVRALIPDIELLPVPDGPDEYIFSDKHIEAFLTVGGSVLRAAAYACETLGTSEGLISKVIKTEDLQTDGAKLMGQFLARARQLRRDAELYDDSDDVFTVIPYSLYPPQREPR